MDRVQLAVEEFERLKQELAGIKPPDSLRPQHDMLQQSTILALMATRLRLEGFRTLDSGDAAQRRLGGRRGDPPSGPRLRGPRLPRFRALAGSRL